MRILFLTNGFPFPLTSGRLRSYHLMRELAQRHTVTLLSLVGSDFHPEHQAAIEAFADRVAVFPTAAAGSAGRWSKVIHRARRMAVGLSPPLARMQAAVADLLRREEFDAVVFSLGTFPAIARLSTPPLVADVCDAALMHIRDRIEKAGWSDALLLRLAHRARQRLERRVFARADHLLFATPRDLAAGAGDAAPRASVVPNGVDGDYWNRQSGRLGRRTIIFTGAMQYPPNTDAALLLAEQVLPRVRRELPDAELLLVGRDPPPALRRAERFPGVTVTGFVDDMRPYLERASLFAAPLRFGAGIQNKLLEALAMELPCIATKRAADGLRTAEGERPPLEQAEGPDEFARAISRRLREIERDGRPDAAAREFVTTHFTWDACGRRLEEALESTLPRTMHQPQGASPRFPAAAEATGR